MDIGQKSVFPRFKNALIGKFFKLIPILFPRPIGIRGNVIPFSVKLKTISTDCFVSTINRRKNFSEKTFQLQRYFNANK